MSLSWSFNNRKFCAATRNPWGHTICMSLWWLSASTLSNPSILFLSARRDMFSQLVPQSPHVLCPRQHLVVHCFRWLRAAWSALSLVPLSQPNKCSSKNHFSRNSKAHLSTSPSLLLPSTWIYLSWIGKEEARTFVFSKMLQELWKLIFGFCCKNKKRTKRSTNDLQCCNHPTSGKRDVLYSADLINFTFPVLLFVALVTIDFPCSIGSSLSRFPQLQQSNTSSITTSKNRQCELFSDVSLDDVIENMCVAKW